MAEKRTGRIVRSLSGFYDVQTPEGVVTCRGRGSLRKNQESPLTGDMVEITVENGKGMVEKILPRRNRFVRPAVANVDALVVFAANTNPVTEPFLIDRVVAIAGDQEVPVYIVINKCDLDPAVNLARIYQNAGFSVIVASAETGEGGRETAQPDPWEADSFYGQYRRGKIQYAQSALPPAEPCHRRGLGKIGQRTAYHPSCGAV